MTTASAAFLGIVQGLCEFLPVSSSGHLVLGAALLDMPAPGLSFSILVHLGTALATVVMLWREVTYLARGLLGAADRDHKRRALSIAGLLVLASVPAALVGIFAGGLVDRLFSSPRVAAVGLLVTGTVLYLTRRPRQRVVRDEPDEMRSVSIRGAALVGIAQAIAIIPGVSRSGMTISTGLLAGMSREDAARFSFLLALPAVIGAASLDLRTVPAAGASILTRENMVAAASAFVSGMVALSVVFRAVKRGDLAKFAYYCWLLGLASLIFLQV